jgi:N-acetylglucosamine kinase-like BadF-type ATPase
VIGLGIDAGGTGTRWRLQSEAGPLAEGEAGPLSGHLYRPQQRAEAAETLAALAADVRSHADPERVVAGITGLDSHGTEHAFLTGVLAARFELPVRAVRVIHDIPLAYRSGFAPGEGILLYAGTGSIAFHLTADGREVRAGGHGYIIDDAGGGFWLGQQALRRIVRARDERGANAGSSPDVGPLERAVVAHIGDGSWDAIRAYVYGGGRSAVAALAPTVVAAEAEGDAGAREILEGAGRELARLAVAVRSQLGAPLPLGFAGGISRLGGPLERSLRDALLAGSDLIVVTEAPVATAARLALEGDGSGR